MCFLVLTTPCKLISAYANITRKDYLEEVNVYAVALALNGLNSAINMFLYAAAAAGKPKIEYF